MSAESTTELRRDRLEMRISTALLLVSAVMWCSGVALAYLFKWYLPASGYSDVTVSFLLLAPFVTLVAAGCAAIGLYVFRKRVQFLIEFVVSALVFLALWASFGG